MDVTLRQIRAFVALAHAGSFTRAAEMLHVTQSALSGLIKELEAQLGVTLVDRTTRRARLSEVGEEFLIVSSRVLRDLDGALENIDNLKRLRRGIVRIAAPQLMASTLVPAVIADFRRQHPDVQVHLRDCAVERVISSVLQGEVDFGIGPERQHVAGLYAEPLFNPPFMAVFPKGHPLEQRRTIGWNALSQYPLIVLQGQFTDQLQRDLQRHTAHTPIQPSQEVAFMSTALSMVNAGMGVSICLPYAQFLVDLYGLQTRPLIEPQVHRRFFIYSRQPDARSPAAQVFIGFLHRHVRDES